MTISFNMNDIVAFFFRCNRGFVDMSELDRILANYKRDISLGRCKPTDADFLRVFYMILHCRDMYFGKGERELSYRMILVLYSYFPLLAESALRHMLLGIERVGSWNDVKYFSLFLKRASPLGFDHPLCKTCIHIANMQLREDCVLLPASNASKWIPRERGHKELYDRFVLDWFGSDYATSSMKREYRKVVVGIDRSICHFSRTIMGVGSVGDYVKRALGLDAGIIDLDREWSRMLRSFDMCIESIAVVDIDIEISEEGIMNALGYACMIAQKSGSMRVLLISGSPIWVDLTMIRDRGFVGYIRALWEHCECRSRVNFEAGLDLIYRGMRGIDSGVKLFLFSERFGFDWTYMLDRLGGRATVIFWNIGNIVNIPSDFYAEDHKELILMSGYAPRLLLPFCGNIVGGSYEFISEILDGYALLTLGDSVSGDSGGLPSSREFMDEVINNLYSSSGTA